MSKREESKSKNSKRQSREMVHVYLTREEKDRVENESRKLGISTSSYIKVRLFSKNLIIFLILISIISQASLAIDKPVIPSDSFSNVNHHNLTKEVEGMASDDDRKATIHYD